MDNLGQYLQSALYYAWFKTISQHLRELVLFIF